MATDWADIKLYLEEDLAEYEQNIISGLPVDSKTEAVKEHFEQELLLRFEKLQEMGVDAEDDSFLLLDHFDDSNPRIVDSNKVLLPLKRSAVFYCLYLLFTAEAIDESHIYYKKAAEYKQRYKEAWEYGCRNLKFDDTVTDLGQTYGNIQFDT